MENLISEPIYLENNHDISKEIHNSDILYYSNVSSTGVFLEMANNFFTSMQFPSGVKSGKSNHVSYKQNYDYFIRTMAELVKKYNV